MDYDREKAIQSLLAPVDAIEDLLAADPNYNNGAEILELRIQTDRLRSRVLAVVNKAGVNAITRTGSHAPSDHISLVSEITVIKTNLMELYAAISTTSIRPCRFKTEVLVIQDFVADIFDDVKHGSDGANASGVVTHGGLWGTSGVVDGDSPATAAIGVCPDSGLIKGMESAAVVKESSIDNDIDNSDVVFVLQTTENTEVALETVGQPLFTIMPYIQLATDAHVVHDLIVQEEKQMGSDDDMVKVIYSTQGGSKNKPFMGCRAVYVDALVNLSKASGVPHDISNFTDAEVWTAVEGFVGLVKDRKVQSNLGNDAYDAMKAVGNLMGANQGFYDALAVARGAYT